MALRAGQEYETLAKGSGDDAVEGQAKTSVVRIESAVAAAMAEVAHSSVANRFVAPEKCIVGFGVLMSLQDVDY